MNTCVLQKEKKYSSDHRDCFSFFFSLPQLQVYQSYLGWKNGNAVVVHGNESKLKCLQLEGFSPLTSFDLCPELTILWLCICFFFFFFLVPFDALIGKSYPSFFRE